MPTFLDTAGEQVSFECDLPWVAELIAEGAPGELREQPAGVPSVAVRIERTGEPFDTRGWELLARGAWSRNGEVVVENGCTAGFDVHTRCLGERAEFTYRWRPPTRERVAARALRSRFHLLARAMLMQYPALWWAGTRGRVPLHATACTAGAATPLITAQSGVGRSTLVLAEVNAGQRATGDNLAVGDGNDVWGLVEPMRIDGGGGRRMPHGRSEVSFPNRGASLAPDALVVLERGRADEPSLSRCTPDEAARALVTATYMAGELRRYWQFAATLAAATGMGPAHPPVADVAASFADALPCFLLALGDRSRARLSYLFDQMGVAA